MDTNGESAANALSVGADPALSRLVRAELLATLHVRANLDPEQAERELAARDMRAEFAQAFAGLGLAADNLPDLLAAHLIAMWTVVHDAPLPRREVATGLAKQFAGLVGGTAQAADPAKRQLMGEALLYETVLSLEAQAMARAAGDKAKLKEMARSAQDNTLAQRGINLRKTRLTTTGMARA